MIPQNVCCITLNPEFLPGFKATMTSILQHTKNFSERIVCIDLKLSPKHRAECLRTYPDIQFVKPLHENYKRLPEHSNSLTNAFYKLEIFRLARLYNRLLFFDCDMVFTDSIAPLLKQQSSANLSAVHHPKHHQYNTGLMLLPKLGREPYRRIIGLVKTMKKAWLADQSVIIQAIADKAISVSKLEAKWNVTKRQARNEGKRYVGLHFVGKKPWNGGEKGYEKIEQVWHKYAGK